MGHPRHRIGPSMRAARSQVLSVLRHEHGGLGLWSSNLGTSKLFSGFGAEVICSGSWKDLTSITKSWHFSPRAAAMYGRQRWAEVNGTLGSSSSLSEPRTPIVFSTWLASPAAPGPLSQSETSSTLPTAPAADVHLSSCAHAAPAASTPRSRPLPFLAFQPHPSSPKFLVTGALGQIGLEFVPLLRSKFGEEAVVASDIRDPPAAVLHSGPFVFADATVPESLAQALHESKATHVVHLASVLSASGELNPKRALEVNTRSIQNVLEMCRKFKTAVFAPSSIAVFGPSTPKDLTPDNTVMDPTTIYGITKVHLELLGQYYHRTHQLDFRSLRFPGIVSALSMPGGGTTDYAVDIFHAAVTKGEYCCFLEPGQRLPMMYMPDCLKATVQLMSVPRERLSQCVYNVGAMSFTPRELAEVITDYFPTLVVEYEPDFRQAIAETWPHTVLDLKARTDWGWCPEFDLRKMTREVIQKLLHYYGVGSAQEGDPLAQDCSNLLAPMALRIL